MRKLGAVACGTAAALAVSAPTVAAPGPQVAWSLHGSAGVHPKSSGRILAVNAEGTGALLSLTFPRSTGLGTLRAAPLTRGRASDPARTLTLAPLVGVSDWAVGPSGELLVALGPSGHGSGAGSSVVSFANGAWGPITPIGPRSGGGYSQGHSTAVCIDRSGRAFAAWLQVTPADPFQSHAFVAERASNGTWGPAVDLGPSHGGGFDDLITYPLALSCTGNRPLVVWEDVSGPRLRVAERGDQGWFPAGIIPLPATIEDFQVAAVGDDAAIAWHQSLGEPGTWAVARRGRGGAWAAPHRFSGLGTDQAPELATTPKLRFVVAWVDGAGRLIAATLGQNTSQAWSRRITIARGDLHGDFSVAALGRTGVVTFERRGQVFARTFDLGRLQAGPPGRRLPPITPRRTALGGDLVSARVGLLAPVVVTASGLKRDPTFLVRGMLR